MTDRIAFNRALPLGVEAAYVAEVMTSGRIGSGGKFGDAAEQFLSDCLGGGDVLLTSSCTDALEMAALLANVSPADEVILPSFTFVSTANAFCLRGATPRFVDIEPNTLNIDPNKIEDAISPLTRAIVPVHYAGVPCDMKTIMKIAERHSLIVIEDAAQALGSRLDGRPVGRDGAMSAFSFHETKNVTCGEGGALIINDPSLSERARILRDKGTNRHDFALGRVDKYSWVDAGSSFGMSELSAAFLLAQLEKLDEISARRRAICERYGALLAPLEAAGHLHQPTPAADVEGNGHLYYILLENEAVREQLILHLERSDIQSVFHYVPLHTSAMGQSYGYQKGDFPVTEAFSARLLRLPLYFSLSASDQIRVADSIFDFFGMSR